MPYLYKLGGGTFGSKYGKQWTTILSDYTQFNGCIFVAVLSDVVG